MKTKHTPGPWTIKQDTKPLAIYSVGPDGIEEESVFKTPLGHVFRSHIRGHEGQQLANAKLIAAAPDLLEAAIWAVKALEKLNSGDDGYQAMIELEQAIKRATE